MFWGLISRCMMPLLWAMGQGLHDLGNEMECLPPIEGRTLLLHILLESNAVDKFHHDIFHVGGTAHVINGHDIGMGQHRHSLGLIVEPAAELSVLCQIVPEDLDGHQAVEPVTAGFVDHRHAAGADDLQYLIPVIQHFPYVLIHEAVSSLGYI